MEQSKASFWRCLRHHPHHQSVVQCDKMPQATLATAPQRDKIVSNEFGRCTASGGPGLCNCVTTDSLGRRQKATTCKRQNPILPSPKSESTYKF